MPASPRRARRARCVACCAAIAPAHRSLPWPRSSGSPSTGWRSTSSRSGRSATICLHAEPGDGLAELDSDEWLSGQLARGAGVGDLSRRLHVTPSTVRNALRHYAARRIERVDADGARPAESDPQRRFAAATGRLERATVALERARRLQASAVKELHQSGLTIAAIADRLRTDEHLVETLLAADQPLEYPEELEQIGHIAPTWNRSRQGESLATRLWHLQALVAPQPPHPLVVQLPADQRASFAARPHPQAWPSPGEVTQKLAQPPAARRRSRVGRAAAGWSVLADHRSTLAAQRNRTVPAAPARRSGDGSGSEVSVGERLEHRLVQLGLGEQLLQPAISAASSSRSRCASSRSCSQTAGGDEMPTTGGLPHDGVQSSIEAVAYGAVVTGVPAAPGPPELGVPPGWASTIPASQTSTRASASSSSGSTSATLRRASP